MELELQSNLFGTGQPDEEAIKLLQFYEQTALMRDPRGYCVCTSEGKDSRVLGHLMRRAGVRHFYVHNKTGIDPPELVYFQRRNFQRYHDMGLPIYDLWYTKSILQLARQEKFPPTRIIRYCCREMKEQKSPEQGEAMIATGVRKAESTRRKRLRSELEAQNGDAAHKHLTPYSEETDRELLEGCMNNPEWSEGLLIINPLAEWPDRWIWDYSREAHLEQCSLYQEGFDRLGCVGCPQASEACREFQFKRWPGIKRIWMRVMEICIEERRRTGLPTTGVLETPQTLFDWWMSGKARAKSKDNKGQLSIELNK